jgi:integrase
MTDEAMSPLRRRMIEDMTIRKLSPKTQQGYIRTIKDLAAFLGRSPDKASFEDVRRFQLHLAAKGAQIPILNHTVAALRFFFRVTLKRYAIVEHTAFIHEPRKLPVVLSLEEVARFLDAAPGLKYKTALSVTYGAGLRAAEVVSLKVTDIDSKRMVIRVEQGNRAARSGLAAGTLARTDRSDARFSLGGARPLPARLPARIPRTDDLLLPRRRRLPRYGGVLCWPARISAAGPEITPQRLMGLPRKDGSSSCSTEA